MAGTLPKYLSAMASEMMAEETPDSAVALSPSISGMSSTSKKLGSANSMSS